MNFPRAVASGFKGYVDFSGRASRSQFWYWRLFLMLSIAPIYLYAFFSATRIKPDRLSETIHFPAVFEMLGAFLIIVVLLIATFLPSLALAVRRLHDSDRSGWWWLLAFTGIGGLWLLVWEFEPGTRGANRFGDNPEPSPLIAMTFRQAVNSLISRMFDFEGRSSRSEYWFFHLLYNLAAWCVFGAIMVITIGVLFDHHATVAQDFVPIVDRSLHGFRMAQWCLEALALMPGLAVSVRRLHDHGYSGWWLLLILTGVGGILLLIWYCQRGTVGANRYGPDPLTSDEPPLS